MFQEAEALEKFVPLSSLGTLRNEDGNAKNDGSEKLHFWFALTFLYGLLGFCFLALNFVNKKMIKCFSMKQNKY